MFDNMTHDDMAAAIELIAGRAKTECSGNVDASNIRTLADLGVDYISWAPSAHSAPTSTSRLSTCVCWTVNNGRPRRRRAIMAVLREPRSPYRAARLPARLA